jgi:hypothetical protein
VLLVHAAALQLAARFAVRVVGLSGAVRLAQIISARSTGVDDLTSLQWALASSARRIGGTCLTQALAARALGASSSREARLVIGVRRGPSAVKGPVAPEFHAWTEIAGVVLPATPDMASFTPVTRWS